MGLGYLSTLLVKPSTCSKVARCYRQDGNPYTPSDFAASRRLYETSGEILVPLGEVEHTLDVGEGVKEQS